MTPLRPVEAIAERSGASGPAWRRDFPVRSDDDQFVTRREFGRFLAVTSLGLLAGTWWTALRTWLRRVPAPPPPLAVARVDEIPLGGSRLFRFPGPNDPAILLRLPDGELAAFSQLCTHLNCPVHFEPERRRLRCPCHEGFFDAGDGRVLGGPPPRPLPRIEVEVRDGRVWALGIDAPRSGPSGQEG